MSEPRYNNTEVIYMAISENTKQMIRLIELLNDDQKNALRVILEAMVWPETEELTEEEKIELDEAIKEMEQGQKYTMEEAKKRLGL